MLILVLLMSALLGAASFGAGLIPLSFTFSGDHITKLATLGTGLLLGTALGVIIPEGIESVIKTHPDSPPINIIAFSLTFGFTFMLVVEQLVSPHSHSPPQDEEGAGDLVFDIGEVTDNPNNVGAAPKTKKLTSAPMTFGLILHALADGLALGVSSSSSGHDDTLSFIVFFALIIHKAPTALALTTHLLTKNLPRNECKTHLLVFSASTPIGAIVSYLAFSFFLPGVSGEKWAGVALLISGGTFLYVATVLQSVSSPTQQQESGMKDVTRVGLIVIGIFSPFVLSFVLGHGH